MAAEASSSRLRLMLEVSRPVNLLAGGTLTPTLEVGVRRDGGDAENGAGVETSVGLTYATAWGLSAEVRVHALVAHNAGDYREWGAGGMVRFDPGREGLGLNASLAPAWDVNAGGTGHLWSQQDAQGLTLSQSSPSPSSHMDVELGYGLRALNGRGVLTPYARASLTEGRENTWHLGTRLALADSLDLRLEATHRQRPDEGSAQELALLATMPW